MAKSNKCPTCSNMAKAAKAIRFSTGLNVGKLSKQHKFHKDLQGFIPPHINSESKTFKFNPLIGQPHSRPRFDELTVTLFRASYNGGAGVACYVTLAALITSNGVNQKDSFWHSPRPTEIAITFLNAQGGTLVAKFASVEINCSMNRTPYVSYGHPLAQDIYDVAAKARVQFKCEYYDC